MVSCRALGVTESWFYKWRDRPPTERQRRRSVLDQKVTEVFKDSGGTPRIHGSPRVYAELRDQGLEVSEKTVAQSMAHQGPGSSPEAPH